MSKRLSTFLLALILVSAAVLRVWQLDRAALWWDEGNNAYFAHQSLAGLLAGSRLTSDTNPPAHRLALRLWLSLLGDSAFNLRLLSAVLGVATVLLVYWWGDWLGGRPVGLLSALLAAFSPMAVRYCREAKSYPFVAFFGSLAVYLWARYLDGHDRPQPFGFAHLCLRPRCRRGRPWLWLAYVLAGALALGAHYYAVLLSAAQGVWLIVSSIHSGQGRVRLLGRRWRNWLLAQAATAALVTPWLLLTYQSALQGARDAPLDRGALALLPYLEHVCLTLAAGPGAARWSGTVVTVASVVLGLAALKGVGRGHGARTGSQMRRSRAQIPPQVVDMVEDTAERGTKPAVQGRLLAAVVTVPVILAFFLQRAIPFFSARFFLYLTPAACVLVALGLVHWRKVGLALGGLLALAWMVALPAAYAPYAKPEEDLRPIARSLQDAAMPGDCVIVGYVWQEGMLRIYAPRAPVHYHLGWFSPETVDEELRSLLALYPRLWVLTYRAPLQHPVSPGGQWLETHAARALLVESGFSRLALYLPPCGEVPSGAKPVRFEGGISLSHGGLAKQVRPGEPFPVTLEWTVDQQPTLGYAVFVHLVREGGRPWGQSDGDPVNGLKPFPQFEPGQPVVDCRAVLPAADTPAGSYTVIVGLYRRDTGQRLRVISGPDAGSDAHTIGQVEVMPRPG